jgi:hypothetical protein
MMSSLSSPHLTVITGIPAMIRVLNVLGQRKPDATGIPILSWARIAWSCLGINPVLTSQALMSDTERRGLMLSPLASNAGLTFSFALKVLR